MYKNKLLKEAVILLLAMIMVTSTLSVANTRNTTTHTADVDSKEVWIGYTSDPQATKGVTWLHYDDGALETMVGSSYPPLFMAIRLTNEELAPYNGLNFVETSWYHVVSNASIPDHVYDAKIWIGNETRPITLLLNDTNLTASGEGWTNHTLSAPITIDASNDYWIVIKCYAYPATAYYDYPMPFDTNPASNISLKSKWWHNSNGYQETDFYEVATLNGAWLLRIAVEGTEDTTPPETTCSLSGTMQGGVYVTDVTATLTATDDDSGVNYTTYKVDNGAWTVYTDPFVVMGNGEHTIAFYSVDNVGNIETEKSVSFTIQYPIVITIKGGLGITATIKNNGTSPVTNLSWSITLDGKLMFVGKSKTGVIPTLGAGNETDVKDFVFGFGKTNIAVSAGGVDATAAGTVILFFVIGV